MKPKTIFTHIPFVDKKRAWKTLNETFGKEIRNGEVKFETIFSHPNSRLIEDGKVVFGCYDSYPEFFLTVVKP